MISFKIYFVKTYNSFNTVWETIVNVMEFKKQRRHPWSLVINYNHFQYLTINSARCPFKSNFPFWVYNGICQKKKTPKSCILHLSNIWGNIYIVIPEHIQASNNFSIYLTNNNRLLRYRAIRSHNIIYVHITHNIGTSQKGAQTYY